MTIKSIVPFHLSGSSNSRYNANKLTRDFNAEVIKHNQFKKAMTALNNTFLLASNEGSGMILDGEPGLGKTMVINTFVKDFYTEFSKTNNVYEDERINLPVIAIKIPSRPTMPRVIEKILSTANHIKPTSQSRRTLENRLDKVIEHQNVQMLILDEYHHLLKTTNYTRDTLNYLKVLADEHNLSIVLSGLTSGIEVLKNHEELLERLSLYHITLSAFNMRTKDNYIDYLSYLIALDSVLANLGIKCCALAKHDFAKRLLLATKGKPRLIGKLINQLILENASKKITQSTFENVFKNLSINTNLKSFNPFNPSSNIKTVEKKIQEFENAALAAN